MEIAYIPTSHAVRDPEGQSRSVKAELRVEPSEGWSGELQISVNGHETGREFINVTLAQEQVRNLRAACDEFLRSE